MTWHYNNENYNNDEILEEEKQVVFEEETLSHYEAWRECYNQKQKLINEDDYDEDYDEDDEKKKKKKCMQ